MLYDYDISELVRQFIEFIFWLFFNVILPLLPLILNLLCVRLMRNPPSWDHVLKEGELLIFSTTVSATALGKSVLERDANDISENLILIVLLLIIIVSSFMSSISFYRKLENKSQDLFDDRKFSYASLALAFLAGLFSFIVWV